MRVMGIYATPYVKDGIELDQIAVHGIRVKGSHGVYSSERETGQLFFADVVAHVSTRAAASSDDLTRTLNYSEIADKAAGILAGDPSNLLETVAEHIALAILEMEGVQCVDVIVHKPQAPLHVEFKDVTVRIRRDLRTGGLWSDKRIGSSAGMPDDPLALGSPAPSTDEFDARPDQPVKAVLALGANLGDMAQTLSSALGDLHRITGIQVTGASPLVQTTPVGGPPQPDYFNAVINVSTSLSPRELLQACQGIEMVYGRERTVENGPRTLDIDIIAFGDLVGETADLTLPHPRAHERGFVLSPWAAFDADAVLPGPHGGRVGDLVQRVDLSGVQVVAQPQAADAGAAPGADSDAAVAGGSEPTHDAADEDFVVPDAGGDFAPEPVEDAGEPAEGDSDENDPSPYGP